MGRSSGGWATPRCRRSRCSGERAAAVQSCRAPVGDSHVIREVAGALGSPGSASHVLGGDGGFIAPWV